MGGGGVLYRVKIFAQSQSNQPFDWSLIETIEPFVKIIFSFFMCSLLRPYFVW